MVVTQLTLTISGGAPYGLRLATDANQRVVVDKVRKSGKADEAGLREGDVVLSINGQSCSGGDSVKASQWIDASSSPGQKLIIQVTRGASDPLRTDEGVGASKVQHLASRDQTVSTKTSFTRSSVEPVIKSVQSVQGSTCTDFTIKAPTGVDVQQNADRSFTVTIGMPFALDIGQSSEKTKPSQIEEQFSSKHSIMFQKEDATQQPQPPQQVTDAVQSSPPVLRTKQLERILSEGSGSEPSTPSSTDGGPSRSGKKLFVDSAFYDDPQHKYPTVEEQVQLARQVAQSVLSPANLKSKGHRMFIRRKERAFRWTTGLSDEEKAQLVTQMAESKEGAEGASEAQGPGSPQAPPHSMPTSVMFAPKLPTEKDVDRLNAMSNDELDRMILQERKTTHTNVSPQMCFSLVDDLRNMKGKGGKLFAKRQAKSETWDKSSGDQPPSTEAGEGSTTPDPTPEALDPRIGEKLKAAHKLKAANREPECVSSGAMAPVNRLKDLVEIQKAAMTPWDAAAQFGSVEKAFEHLDSSSNPSAGRQKPSLGQQSIADSIHQQQRRREGGAGGGGVGRTAMRPKSTIGCVGRSGEEAKRNVDENQSRAKIEALGGNPNATGLASAMTASLAAARSSAGGGGYRSVKVQRTTTTSSKAGEAETQSCSSDRSCSPKAPLHA